MVRKRFSKIEPQGGNREASDLHLKPLPPDQGQALQPLHIDLKDDLSAPSKSPPDLKINPAYLPKPPSETTKGDEEQPLVTGSKTTNKGPKGRQEKAAVSHSRKRLLPPEQEFKLAQARKRLHNAWMTLFILLSIPLVIYLVIRMKFLLLIVLSIPAMIIAILHLRSRP